MLLDLRKLQLYAKVITTFPNSFCKYMERKLSEIKIKDIMTTRITAAKADDMVSDIAQVMIEKNYGGIPIVDNQKKLIGMITLKELLDQDGIFLPTAIKILHSFQTIHGEDVSDLDKRLKHIKSLKSKDVMDRNPAYLSPSATLENASEAFMTHHRDVLPVIDQDKTLLGIISKYDILKSLTANFQPLVLHPDLNVERRDKNAFTEVEKKFVVISRARVKIWYMGFLVFLIIGMLVATLFILRIRIN